MRSIKLKPKNLINYPIFLICICIFLIPKESDGAKYLDNQIDTSITINDLPSGINDSIPATLQEGSTIPENLSALVTEEPEGKIQEKFKLIVNKPYNKINDLILWLLGDKNVSEYKLRMIDFGNNNLPLFLRDYYMNFVLKTYTYPIIVLFLIMIAGLILNVTIVLLVMYFINKTKNHRERYIHIYRSSYEEVLRSFLFGDIEWDLARLKLKKLNNPLNRKILTDVLLIFQENLRGEMDSQIPQIFKKLGLEKDSIKLSKSIFYFRRIKGLKALTNLDPENARKVISNFLNDSHITVRTEAQVAHVRLHPEQPFEFLKTLKKPFTRWTQLSSFYILRQHQVPIPAFIDYLDSENPTIRNFSLRMIIFFQQLENASEIYKLLDSPFEITRFLSIQAINDLRLYDGKNLIKSMYQSETERNKLEIIKALKNIGDKEDFDFLGKIIHSESISFKTEACRSLYYVNNEGRERLNFLNQNVDLKIDQFLAHVTNPRN
jgi:hypothetical protein